MTKKPTRKQPVPRLLWLFIMLAMIVTVSIPQLIPAARSEGHAPAFYCALGLGASVALILVGRLIGFVLRRPESYWLKSRSGGAE